ncbi:MAG: hypothetical protein DCF19_11720 [Pseudanabaena frigida]|uniref:Uncharacterized protein n=1 Tax=Pseudanabaena frigida TaxID=945775 RepID=A0A2W4WF80_9CYAN|nr:MAG: hypothetical protein DCF19_11720 [Pseudanabaena frigida]
MQYSFRKFTLALAIAIGVNTSSFVMPRNCLALLDNQAIAAEPSELPAVAKQLIGKWQLTMVGSELEPLTLLFMPDGKLYLINSTRQSVVQGEYQIHSVNGQVYLDIFQGSFGARTNFSFNSKGQLILQQLFIPAVIQLMYSSNSNEPNIIGGLLMPNILSLTRISSDTNVDANLNFALFQSPANRARQSEAKSYVGAINRAQQAFFLEKEYFTSKLYDLGIGISSETENYKYQIVVIDSKKGVQNIAIPKKDNLKAYTGFVNIRPVVGTQEMTSVAMLCESLKPTRDLPSKFKLSDKPTCPEGYIVLSRY